MKFIVSIALLCAALQGCGGGHWEPQEIAAEVPAPQPSPGPVNCAERPERCR